MLAIVVLVLGAGTFGLVIWQRIDRVHVEFPGSPPGGTTYLLIGSDSRAFVSSPADRLRFGPASVTPGERADIALLVRAVPGHRLRIVGIPRDLVTQYPDGSPVRFALTLLRGPQAVVDTACRSLGLGIDHVVLIHFDGLRRLVDSVGGVDIRVPFPERDHETGLAIDHAGKNHLDGQKALAYVRSREVVQLKAGSWQLEPLTAQSRAHRARMVLSQLGPRLRISPSNPIEAARRLWALSAAVTVDDDASPFALRNLARSLSGLGTADESELPVTFHPGDVPRAYLTPRAAAVLGTVDGTTPGCSFRLLQDPEREAPRVSPDTTGPTP